MKTFQILAAAGLAAVAQAHMEMIWPPPFKSKANPFAGQDIDYSMTSPLEASGSNYPCKGYQSVLGTAAGKSVVDWTPGEKYNLTLSGSAIHGGGSCQASLSYDKAKTFTAIHSFIGNCPTGPVDLEFTLPSDAPSGEAVFAWSWFNEIGNREMYMNCASITVAGGSSKRDTSFDSRPAMFAANVNNGCSTTEGKDVKFPDPGPDVTNGGTNTGPPVGKCASGSGSDGGSDGGSGGGDAASTTAETPDPTTTAAQDPAPTDTTVPGGIFITQTDPASPEPTEPADSTPTATPSTMMTVTTPSTPNPTPTGGSGGSDGGSGGFSQGTACTSEGDWNCVSGSQFQRCASGMWSALIPMAGGTSCSPGQSSTLNMVQRRGGSRIYNV